MWNIILTTEYHHVSKTISNKFEVIHKSRTTHGKTILSFSVEFEFETLWSYLNIKIKALAHSFLH